MMIRVPLLVLVVSLLVTAAVAPRAVAEDAPDGPPLPVAEVKRDAAVSFEKEILPVLSANCLACHNRTKAKGDLVLETPTDILKGGESGPAVVAKKAEESLLFKVSGHRAEPVMPPKGNKVAAANLTPEQLGLLKLWIDQGAGGTIGGGAGGGPGTPSSSELQPVPAGLNAVYAVAVTPDGQYAAAARGGEVHVYHLPTQRLVSRLSGHRDLVQSLAFSPDGNVLASGAYREVKLWRRARDVKRFNITSAHRGGVNAVDVAPDGATFATGGADGVVRVWGAADGRPVRELSGHAAAVTAVRFSPDGARIASASADKSVRVWSVADGAAGAHFATPAEAVAVAWVGPKQVAAAGGDAVVRVWDVPDAASAAAGAPKELKGHEGAVQCLAAVPGAPTHLLSGGADGTVRWWDVNTGKVLRQVKHGGAVNGVAVRPDGKRVASAGADGVVKLWDGEGKPVAEMKGDRYANEAAATRGRDLAFAAAEVAYHKSSVENHDKRQAEQIDRVKKAAAADTAAEAALAEKQKAKAAADAKKAEVEKKKTEAEASKVAAEKKKADADARKAEAVAKKTDADAKKAEADAKNAEVEVKKAEADVTAAEAEVKKAQEDVKQVEAEVKKAAEEATKVEAEVARAQSARAAAADELRLGIKSAQDAADAAAGALAEFQGAEREHKQVEAEAAALKAAAAAAVKPVRAVAFSPDGQVLAAAGDDGVMHTYGAETGGAYETYRDAGGAVVAVALSGIAGGAGGSDIGIITAVGGVVVGWATGAQWLPEKHLGDGGGGSAFADRVTALDFSADGKFLATGGGGPSREGEVMLWDVGAATLVRRFERLHSDTVLALDLSADGKLLATGAADRFLKVSEVAGGKLLKTFEGHTGHVLGVAFQRTGRTLASGSADNTVKVWDFVGGEQKKTIAGFEKEVTSVRFLGDTDQFVATAGDGNVRLLRPDGGEVRKFAGFSGFVYAAAAPGDGSVIIAGGGDGTLRAWNAATGQPVATLPAPDAAASK